MNPLTSFSSLKLRMTKVVLPFAVSSATHRRLLYTLYLDPQETLSTQRIPLRKHERIPAASTGTTGGCMLAFKKKQPWSHAVSPVPLPPGFSPGIACAPEITTITRRRKCPMLCCYLATPRQRPPYVNTHTCRLLSDELQTHFPEHAIILGGDLQGNWTDTCCKFDNIMTTSGHIFSTLLA